MSTTIYVLCALTSTLCAMMLWRGYAQSRARLLFWSGWCFVGLALNNVLLIIDLRVISWVSVEMWRTLPALVGVAVLIYGLVWESAR